MVNLSADICRFPSAVWRAIRVAGIEPAAVLQMARLPATVHLDSSTPLTTAQFFAIWKAIEVLVDDRGFALRIIKAADGTGQQPAFIAGLYASNFRDALNRLLRFRMMTCERLWTRDERGLWTMGRDWTYATEAEPALLADLSFSLIVELGRRGTGQHIKPVKVQYARDWRRCDELESYYGCSIQFGAPHNAITFNSADLDIPFPGYSPEFLELITQSFQEAAKELRFEGTFNDRVKSAMKRTMINGRPDIRNIARELGMGVRTLQRRITDLGTNYRALLTEARRELSLQLLMNPDMDIDHITSMLGYQNAASFYRAFKEWEDISPGTWREQHVAMDKC